MTMPTTSFAVAAAVCALGCAAVAALWLAIMRQRTADKRREEAKRELEAAEKEVTASVFGGDANRVRRARRRLQSALDEARRHGVG